MCQMRHNVCNADIKQSNPTTILHMLEIPDSELQLTADTEEKTVFSIKLAEKREGKGMGKMWQNWENDSAGCWFIAEAPGHFHILKCAQAASQSISFELLLLPMVCPCDSSNSPPSLLFCISGFDQDKNILEIWAGNQCHRYCRAKAPYSIWTF